MSNLDSNIFLVRRWLSLPLLHVVGGSDYGDQ